MIFRVFGKTCEGTFIDRQDETIVYAAVAKAGLGPRMLGYDGSLRAEEFLYSRVLLPSQMNSPFYRRKAALALAEFHLISVPKLPHHPVVRRVLTSPRILQAVMEKINKTELFN